MVPGTCALCSRAAAFPAVGKKTHMASDGPSWEGLERGLEPQDDVLVNPTVVGALGVSQREDLGNFQMWLMKSKLVVDLVIHAALGHF